MITGIHVTATDANHKHATADLTVHVVDDVPTANDDVDSTHSGAIADGNVITGNGGSNSNLTDGVADTAGADGIASIAWTGQVLNTVAGSFGTLTVGTNGSYSYLANPEASGVDVFHYTITDGDGDTSSATLTIDVTPPPTRILHVEKDAQVADEVANAVGDVINYTLTVTNTGNTPIANVVVDDPFTTDEAPVLVGGFNSGDTDQDDLLDVNETWHYTASHTVTQADLDKGGNIVNTATVTGDDATPDDDDATVPLRQNKVLHIEKDASVPGGTADGWRDDQLHADSDQYGQRGDRQRGGWRSVHDR